MASTGSSSVILHSLSLTRVSSNPHSPKRRLSFRASALPTTSRRQSLIMLTASTALAAVDFSSAAWAKDIPLFGIRKKLEKVEEAAEEVVIEGVETAEKGIEAAEREIETVLGFGGLEQAGAVIGAEVLGVLVATSVVNGILGPEGQKS